LGTSPAAFGHLGVLPRFGTLLSSHVRALCCSLCVLAQELRTRVFCFDSHGFEQLRRCAPCHRRGRGLRGTMPFLWFVARGAFSFALRIHGRRFRAIAVCDALLIVACPSPSLCRQILRHRCAFAPLAETLLGSAALLYRLACRVLFGWIFANKEGGGSCVAEVARALRRRVGDDGQPHREARAPDRCS